MQMIHNLGLCLILSGENNRLGYLVIFGEFVLQCKCYVHQNAEVKVMMTLLRCWNIMSSTMGGIFQHSASTTYLPVLGILQTFLIGEFDENHSIP